MVSPVQYEGTKNFADRQEAPEVTGYDKWNFIRFGLEDEIKIVLGEK